MITNLRAIMAQAVAAYATTPRKQWVLEWPGQAVLAVSGIYWTQQVRPAALCTCFSYFLCHCTNLCILIRTHAKRGAAWQI